MTKQTLLLLHGALGTREQFNPFIKFLNSKFDIHTMDFAGHGNSHTDVNEASYSIEFFVDEVILYIKENKLQNVNIFGYSMGGYVSLLSAIKNPHSIKKICTLGTKFLWTPKYYDAIKKKLSPEVIHSRFPSFANHLSSIHKVDSWQSIISKTTGMMKCLSKSQPLTEINLQKINVPVIIASGDKDDTVSPEESQKITSVSHLFQFKLMESTPHPLEKCSAEMLSLFLDKFFRSDEF